jgi:hypothetical protein
MSGVNVFDADFTKGVYGGYDPDKVAKGYACFISNAELTSYDIQPMMVPSLQTAVSVPAATADIFEYNGNWFFASAKQDWAAETVGNDDRVYYCSGAGTPQKIIITSGTQQQSPLGISPPTKAPVVTVTPEPVPTSVTLVAQCAVADPNGVLKTDPAGVLAPGTYSYAVGFQVNGVYQAPTAPSSITLKATGSVLISWDPTTVPPGTTGIVIYGRTPGYLQMIIDCLPINTFQWVDEGTLTPIGPPPSSPVTWPTGGGTGEHGGGAHG